MGKDEQNMLEQRLEEIVGNYGPRIHTLEQDAQQFRLEMSNLKLANTEVQNGLAEVKGTVSGMGREVHSLSQTVSRDGKETRDMLKTAFDHVMAGNDKQAEFKFSKLEAKTKVALGVIAVLGGGGIWAGIAGLIAVL